MGVALTFDAAREAAHASRETHAPDACDRGPGCWVRVGVTGEVNFDGKLLCRRCHGQLMKLAGDDVD